MGGEKSISQPVGRNQTIDSLMRVSHFSFLSVSPCTRFKLVKCHVII
jgi:hypothetical protein